MPIFVAIMSKGSLQLSILAAYRRIHGHLLIPAKYRVPYTDERWPVEYHHFPLGEHVQFILKQQDKKGLKFFDSGDMNCLRYLGFGNYGVNGYTSYHHLVGFETFKELYDSVDVPSNYVVPRENPWPEPIWGYKLGVVEDNIRKFGDHPTIHVPLVEMGFFADEFSEPELAKIKEAVKAFRRINGHLNVPPKFSIKKTATEYPESVRGVILSPLFPRKP